MADWKRQVRNLQNYSIPQTYCLWKEVKHHKEIWNFSTQCYEIMQVVVKYTPKNKYY